MTAAPIAPATAPPIERLRNIMRQLRNPDGGCEWDIAQNFASIAPYTIEEAYEVADAIAGGSPAAICDELGDLLLQVIFHSQIAEDDGLFTFDDVANAISDKMIRRHPHIFDGTPTANVRAQWDDIKAAERAANGTASSALDGVAHALPALLRAQKLQSRAARTGFDWLDANGPRAKIDEELIEIVNAGDGDARHEEVGDLLFAVVNYARHLGIDSESALRDANLKFSRRFRAMEARSPNDFATLTLDDKENLWREVKRTE